MINKFFVGLLTALMSSVLVLSAYPDSALAAGLFLAPEGARPLARGGAFVAGADDLNATAYNPAGIALAPSQINIDFILPIHSTTYQRTREDSSGGLTSVGTVTGNGIGLPIPNLGATFDFGLVKGLKFAVALNGPTPIIQNWPTTVNGEPAPQRYAIQNYKDTAMIKFTMGAAYQLTDWLILGGAFEVLTGRFASQVAASASISATVEDPVYDLNTKMVASPIVAPGAHLGLILIPAPWVRFGLSWESAFNVSTQADFHMTIPGAGAFNGAEFSPKTPHGTLAFKLPQTLRTGVEVRPIEGLRVELAFIWENWAAHDVVHLDFGNATLNNPAIPPISLGKMAVTRGFQDTYSLRIGSEYTPRWLASRALTLRFGAMYEPSAIPPQYLSAVSVDLDKFIASTGASYRISKNCYVEATYAHVFMATRTVTNSQVFQQNPTIKQPVGAAIGNGTYSSHADIFGLGFRVNL
jgi:long-chain fatty acid transport protein